MMDRNGRSHHGNPIRRLVLVPRITTFRSPSVASSPPAMSLLSRAWGLRIDGIHSDHPMPLGPDTGRPSGGRELEETWATDTRLDSRLAPDWKRHRIRSQHGDLSVLAGVRSPSGWDHNVPRYG